AKSTIAATAERDGLRERRDGAGSRRVSVAAGPAAGRVGIATVGSPSSGGGVVLIARSPAASNRRDYSLRCVRGAARSKCDESAPAPRSMVLDFPPDVVDRHDTKRRSP